MNSWSHKFEEEDKNLDDEHVKVKSRIVQYMIDAKKEMIYLIYILSNS